MKMYDNKRTIEIKLITNGIDWAEDFFDAPIGEKYKVDDVQYCIDQANDYVNGFGDFTGYPQPNTRVEVYEVCESNN